MRRLPFLCVITLPRLNGILETTGSPTISGIQWMWFVEVNTLGISIFKTIISTKLSKEIER